jgi:hypothetical protein
MLADLFSLFLLGLAALAIAPYFISAVMVVLNFIISMLSALLGFGIVCLIGAAVYYSFQYISQSSDDSLASPLN